MTVDKQGITSPNEVGWSCVRVLDYSLPQTMYALTYSQLWLPGEANPLPLPMVALGVIGEIGYYHLQIISVPPNEAPFYKTAPAPPPPILLYGITMPNKKSI